MVHSADKITELWNAQLVSRNRIEEALAHAEVTPVGGWSQYPEAVQLTLAQILSASIGRQLKALSAVKMVSAKDYDRVVAASRKFQNVLRSLQNTDHPPPLLEEIRPGRTLWDDWGTGKQLAWETRGARPGTEQRVLHNLLAFYQLVACTKTIRFSRKEASPLKLFLEVSFKHARDVFHQHITNPEDRQDHSLRAPDGDNLVAQRKLFEVRRRAIERVSKRLSRNQAACVPIPKG